MHSSLYIKKLGLKEGMFSLGLWDSCISHVDSVGSGIKLRDPKGPSMQLQGILTTTRITIPSTNTPNTLYPEGPSTHVLNT